MAGKPSDTKICPECGTRNKAKWDFCVRCGEGLSDVPVGVPEESPAAAAAEDGSGMVMLAVIVVASVLAGILGSRLSLPQTEVDPAVFASGRPMGPRPAARIVETPAGQDELFEGRRLLRSGDAQGSLAALAQAVAERPDDPDAHWAYAQALFRTDSVEEAVTHFEEAALLAPESFRYQLDLGRAAMAAGEPESALLAYQAAIELRAESPGALREAAIALLSLGQTEDAIEALTQAAELVGNSAVLRQDLAGALEKAGRTDEAVAAYRNALEINPGASVARSRLAHMLFHQGQRDEAISLARQGIEHDATQPVPYRDLGSLLEQSGRMKDAAEAYREYARLAPNAADAQKLVTRAGRLDPSTAS